MPPVESGLFLIAILFGTWLVIPKAWSSAGRLSPDMNLLMIVAIAGALGLGAFFEAATVAFFFSLQEPNCDLPTLVRTECGDLIKQIAEQTVRIDAKTKTEKEMAATADTARRLQTMPGVAAPDRLSRANGR